MFGYGKSILLIKIIQIKRNKIKTKKPNDIKIVSFLFKPSVYKFNTNIDWVGFEIEDDFVVGYGLDYNGMYRNKQSVYKIIN